MSPNLEFKVRLIYYLTFLLIRDYGLGWVLSLGFYKVKVAQSCPTLCDPMDYTVHGILQARILEWIAFTLLQGIFPTQGSNQGLLHWKDPLEKGMANKSSILTWKIPWTEDAGGLQAMDGVTKSQAGLSD